MMKLVEALSRFNRKERFWLIRNALGPVSERLDDAFRDKLKATTGIDVPTDAWWAMDYHLDWLVGALTLVNDDERGYEAKANDAALVTGNQEDMDLVVAFDDVLILIEAKGETAWSNSQFASKVARLENLRAAGLLPESVKVYFVVMSPRKPDGLMPAEGMAWQSWMCDLAGRPMHVPLDMPGDFLKVSRWDAARAVPASEGTSWKIVPARRAA